MTDATTKVGDRLFSVTGDFGRAEKRTAWVRVTKVGRRWAEYQEESFDWRHSGHRFDLETMKIDGGGLSSPGRVYRSEEEYQASLRVAALWRRFCRSVERASPNGLTEVDILKAADALKIRLDEVPS